jgi:Tfp pilus assembly protein PilV
LAKSSFSLFETLLSLIILSILVSGFLEFTYIKEDKISSLNNPYNLLLTQQSHPNIRTSSLDYLRSGSNIYLINGTTITQSIYEDPSLKLERNHLIHSKDKEIAFKEVE